MEIYSLSTLNLGNLAFRGSLPLRVLAHTGVYVSRSRLAQPNVNNRTSLTLAPPSFDSRSLSNRGRRTRESYIRLLLALVMRRVGRG